MRDFHARACYTAGIVRKGTPSHDTLQVSLLLLIIALAAFGLAYYFLS